MVRRDFSQDEWEQYRIEHGSEEFLDDYGELMPFEEQFELYLKEKVSRRSQLVIPPAPFTRDGLPYLDRHLFVPMNVLDGARGYPSKHHHLHESVVTDADLEMLPALIYSSPLVIEQDASAGAYLLALYAADTAKFPCVAVIKQKTDTDCFQLEKVISIYGKDTLPFVVGDALINGLSVFTNELTSRWARDLGLSSIVRRATPEDTIADYLESFGKREGIAAERELYAPSDTTKPLFSHYTHRTPKETEWLDLRLAGAKEAQKARLAAEQGIRNGTRR